MIINILWLGWFLLALGICGFVLATALHDTK